MTPKFWTQLPKKNYFKYFRIGWND
jgi:hypothetical protein